jgi:hypothetical protein
MWAYYGTSTVKKGDNNRRYMDGACIEFDTEKILEKEEKKNKNGNYKSGIRDLYFADIDYKKEGRYFDMTIEDDIKFKFKDYSLENEKRAIYRGKDIYFDISGCIKKIYLGADFRNENIKKICEIMSIKRYEDINTYIFTKLCVTQRGLIENIENNGGEICA